MHAYIYVSVQGGYIHDTCMDSRCQDGGVIYIAKVSKCVHIHTHIHINNTHSTSTHLQFRILRAAEGLPLLRARVLLQHDYCNFSPVCDSRKFNAISINDKKETKKGKKRNWTNCWHIRTRIVRVY